MSASAAIPSLATMTKPAAASASPVIALAKATCS
nr:MAG TPA: hypothetical protein [Caudoviricetes sp.]